MSQAEPDTPKATAEESKKKGTLKERARREALTILAVLVSSVCIGASLELLSEGTAKKLREFNARVVESTKNIRPLDMYNSFYERRFGSRYGWRLFSFKEPFNVTAARRRAADELARNRMSLDEYERRVETIESYAFTPDPNRPYVPVNRDGTARAPVDGHESSNKVLSTIFGIPDALIYAFRVVFSQGWPSVLAYGAAYLLALALFATRKEVNPLAVILLAVPLASVIAYLILLPIMWAAKFALWFLNAPQTVALMTVLNYPLFSALGRLAGPVAEHYFQERVMKFVHREK